MPSRPSDQPTPTPTASHGLVLALTEIDRTMISRVGGKAANLGELTQAGFAVPQGFCVTTEAYREVVERVGLDRLLDVGAALGGDDLAGAARKLIVEAPVPEHIRRGILDAYAAMGAGAMVAVRSSATAEDLPFASFAGQQDTYLGVLGAEQLLDAVRRCWASLWTDRAVAYRGTQQIDHRSARLAVVVQAMVHSATAGVLFTANPVTGRRREAVIDASPGLGEAVVSGAVTPDHLVVDTATGRVLESRVGEKGLAIRAVPGGGTERIAATATDQLCLTDELPGTVKRVGRLLVAQHVRGAGGEQPNRVHPHRGQRPVQALSHVEVEVDPQPRLGVGIG